MITSINIKLTKIRQHFPKNGLADVKGEVSKELLRLRPLIKPGGNIAVAAGSRGIKNIALIVREVTDFIRANNANPFIVPAMGSHGNADAETQAQILADYGISEKNLGVPVRSSMDVVELPKGASPAGIFIDKNAYLADGIILINRIKAHTDYHGQYESGLVKMTVIGLGKEKQASAIHSYGVYGLAELIPVVAKQIISSGKIIGGLAIVENAFDDTMLVSALRADEFFEKEPSLLKAAKENMPFIPADNIDLLIIDEMGKNLSGVGVDPNIIGRMKIYGQPEPLRPAVKSIIIADITKESHGNAIGVGLADVIPRRLFNKIDFPSTYTNGITSSFYERIKIPVIAETDREAFDIALRGCGYIKKGEEKVVRIKNTLHLEALYVSDPVLEEIKASGKIEVIERNIGLFNESEFKTF
ncbi:MAG TPA: DUF2088 domain-containing protein [Bacteroidales bacterium]|nr:DUF2088 domain-containing protein [Bacteroidales bacterium]